MLADLVRRCRSADHLPALFAHLGYEADEGAVTDGWRAVARWRTFRVVGTDADDPAGAARGPPRPPPRGPPRRAAPPPAPRRAVAEARHHRARARAPDGRRAGE